MVSVIVPIYNAEKYLSICLDSLLLQTNKDIEIILIDDGSKDDSGIICDSYSVKDKRVKVIHKQNEGVSTARNIGIELAKGEYIMFCDSDDIVHPQWVENHLRALELNNDSLIVSHVARFKDDQIPQIVKKDLKLSPVTYYSLFTEGLSGYPINKIFKKDIILVNNIKFNKNLPIGEDVTFVTDYLNYCKNCIKLDNTLYYYRQLEDSAVHRYHPYMLKYMLNAFYVRIPFIDKQYLQDYCDHWLCEFIQLLRNVHDARNNMTWIEQMSFNQKCLTSNAMQTCMSCSSGKKEHPIIMALLKSKFYPFIYLFNTVVESR